MARSGMGNRENERANGVIRRARRAEAETRALARALRPVATARSYDPKQKEFMDFLEDNYEGLDRQAVTGERLHLFLTEKVLGRAKKRGTGTVGAGTITSYITAITRLWKDQNDLGVNEHQNPRHHTLVQELRRNAAAAENERNRMSMECRFKNSFLDGPTSSEELVRIADEFLKQGRGCDLKHRLAALLSLSAALRGQTTRQLELADLALLDIPSDGPQDCKALMMIIRKGKTNKFGRIEYGSGIRNKLVELCPIGALSLYLFYRFHVQREPFPDFSSKANWHFIKVIPGSKNVGRRKNRAAANANNQTDNANASSGEEDNDAEEEEVEEEEEEEVESEDEGSTENVEVDTGSMHAYFGELTANEYKKIKEMNPEIDYQSQLKAICKVMAKLNIQSSSKTHFFRHASAKTAELNGAPEDEIRRLGRWNNQSLEGVYLSPIPMKAVRSLAGFRPDTKDYCLPRAGVAPPQELQQLIFPSIEAWESKLPTDEIPSHLFKLLKYARIVVLQDSVILRKKFPDHRLFRDDLFRSEAYRNFANVLDSHISANPFNLASTHISAVAPEIIEIFKSYSTKASGDVAGLGTALQKDIAVLHEEILSMKSQLAQQPTQVFFSSLATLLAQNEHGLNADTVEAVRRLLDDARINTVTTESNSTPGSSASPPARARTTNTVASYEMLRSHDSVADIWKEYSEGISGNPSIKSLDDEHGSSWRNSEKDRKFYRTMKTWYTSIADLATRLNVPEAVAARRLESYRLAKGLSIVDLRNRLKTNGVAQYVADLTR